MALAKKGADLVLSSRREDELNKVKESCTAFGVSCTVLPLDVSDPVSIERACSLLFEEKGIVPRVLVLNSGISQRAHALDSSAEVDRKVMEVNFFGLADIAKRTARRMLESGRGGQIAVMSSLAGAFGMPLRTAYSASKHALNGFFESLRAEYGRKGLDVTIIMPGSIRTEISKSALRGDGVPYGIMDERLAKGMEPEKAAGKMIKALSKRKKTVIIAGRERLLYCFRKFLPALYYFLIGRLKNI